jgi:cell division septal protein FtsQ
MKRKRKYKKRNNKFKKLFLGFLGLLFFLVIAFSAFYQYSPNFKIKDFEIVGVKTFSSDELKEEAEHLFIFSFNVFGQEFVIDNIFLSFKNKTDELMKKFPEIESISVKKDFSKSVIYLEVKEKEPVVIWCDNENCSLLDKKASFIRNCDKNEGFPIIEEKDDINLEKQQVIDSSLILEEKLDHYGLKPEKYLIYPEKFVAENIYGCDIIFDLEQEFDWQIEKMEILLKQDRYFSN